jgi:hypothetical protein
MIRIDSDENVHDADLDLVERFAEALIDQDTVAMQEVLYLLDERMSGDCVCLAVDCVCGTWS